MQLTQRCKRSSYGCAACHRATVRGVRCACALLLVAMVAMPTFSPCAFAGPSGRPTERRQDSRITNGALPRKKEVERGIRRPTEPLSATAISLLNRFQPQLLNIASFLFWVFFVQAVIVEDHYVTPMQKRDAAVIQGIGGEMKPQFEKSGVESLFRAK